jgi:hypothetical protein
MKRRMLAGLAAAAVAGVAAPTALPATAHAFRATYAGHGAGAVSGTNVSGSASLTGRGAPIGRGGMTGSATGHFVSSSCVVFDGTAVLRGTAGTVSVAAHAGRACGGGGSSVSFSGHVAVTGGTGRFSGAKGTLSFSGTYTQAGGAVRITFAGRLTY